MFFHLICAAFLTRLTIDAIPIDNGLQGEPEIECGSNSLQISFNTINTFEGHVYVKNRYTEPGCRSDEGGRSSASIRLPFSACGTVRTRSANPRGVFVSSTVVVSFHPNFLTKVDRAYFVQCFYMEADKTVSSDIEVSMITTLLQTVNIPMPVCRYEILDAVDGQRVEFAIVGQPVIHQWTCDSDYDEEIFCMRVHSCFVDDGAGDRVDIIDIDGCSIDKYILQNLEYPSNLKAHKEAHVFKYADRPSLAFQCQIEILVKEPNEECVRPECADPGGAGDGSVRVRREANGALAVVDVRTQAIEPLDTLANQWTQSSLRSLPRRLQEEVVAFSDQPLVVNDTLEVVSNDICLSYTAVGFLFTVLLFAVGIIVSLLAVRSCCQSRKSVQFA